MLPFDDVIMRRCWSSVEELRDSTTGKDNFLLLGDAWLSISPVDSRHKGPVVQKWFLCHDGIMLSQA